MFRCHTHIWPLCLPLLFAACRPDPPAQIPLPTRICIKTLHHQLPITEATVYIKYNADSFPGYTQPAGYFDASVSVGPDARGCIEPVPEGRHWLVALGKDRVYVEYPHDVFGSLPVTISLDGTAKLDTVIYVTEKH